MTTQPWNTMVEHVVGHFAVNKNTGPKANTSMLTGYADVDISNVNMYFKWQTKGHECCRHVLKVTRDVIRLVHHQGTTSLTKKQTNLFKMNCN